VRSWRDLCDYVIARLCKQMIYVVAANVYFVDIATATRLTLVRRGWPCAFSDGPSTAEAAASASDVYIVIGLNVYQGRLPQHYIAYQFEQTMTSPWFTEHYLGLLRGARQVWDYAPANLDWLKSHGGLNHLVWVPLGHTLVDSSPLTGSPIGPNREAIVADKDKDIDVTFFGAVHPRRAAICHALIRSGCRVHWTANVWGTERDRLVDRSKIVLNLHFYTPGILETPRLCYLLGRGAFVVSERDERPGNEALNKPFDGCVVFADYQQVAQSCAHWLRQRTAADREAQAQSMHRCFRQQVAMVDHMDWDKSETILSAFDHRRSQVPVETSPTLPVPGAGEQER